MRVTKKNVHSVPAKNLCLTILLKSFMKTWKVLTIDIRFLLPITLFCSALSNSLGNEEPKSIKNLCFIKWPKKSNGLTKVSESVNSQPYAIKRKIRRKFDVLSTIPQTDHHKLASLEAGCTGILLSS